ncbi:MAG TPA: CBS domain-containing protein [Methanobacterium sp.]|jgi:CBS domain-containing protein|nr:MAG: CBS domain-containing protein [Methanobacterium sp.]HPX77180.1 CBS domain-containing protein [Methanobacterium sp.]
MQVKDIMSREVFLVDKDQNIQDALKIMKKHKVSRLPVINTNNDHIKELVGIMTEKDIARRLGSSRYGNLAPSHFYVSTVMSHVPLTIESNKSIGVAAQIMVENNIGGIPVVDGGEIKGMLTKTDFINATKGRSFQEIQVKDRMTTDPITVGPQDRLVHARRLIFDEDIGRLPVVDGDELQGIVTAKDVARSMISFRKVVPDKYKPARIRNLLVEDVMTQNVKTVSGNASIEEVSNIMAENKFNGLPVLDEGELTGIITKTDLIKLIVEREEVH